MNRIICWLTHHNWSPWYPHVRGSRQYRYCLRCHKTEERIK